MMSSDASPIGRIVGRYEIVREIGRGGMATVHLARQFDLERAVALKELDRVGTGQPGVFASRFVREARLAGSLSHANIVTVFEYFEHDGRPYIAMEYAEGGSLRGYLEALTMAQIFGVLDGLLSALHHAETRGIVHRDIKPENILVTGDGQIKIADFGIAKAYSVMTGDALLTVPGAPIGTPMYMAPEQATGGPLGIAADLYAVGVVAFEMLFGHVPFESGETPIATLWRHVNSPVPDPHALRPDLDHRLCHWLERLLAKQPADRPASAAVAFDELEEIALDVVGNRWRRAAQLPVSAAQERGRSWAGEPDDTPDAPRAVAAKAGARADPDATRGAAQPTIAPRALREQTDVYARPARERDDVTEAKPHGPDLWRSPTAIAAIVLATGVAAVAGYVVFPRGPDPPQPPGPSPPAPAQVAAQRFEAGLSKVLRRLNTLNLSQRKRLGNAKTPRGQANAAHALAAAYRDAAASVGRLTPAAAQRRAAAVMTQKLTLAGDVYDQLAAAAITRNRARYDERRYAIGQRETAVRRAAALVFGR